MPLLNEARAGRELFTTCTAASATTAATVSKQEAFDRPERFRNARLHLLTVLCAQPDLTQPLGFCNEICHHRRRCSWTRLHIHDSSSTDQHRKAGVGIRARSNLVTGEAQVRAAQVNKTVCLRLPPWLWHGIIITTSCVRDHKVPDLILPPASSVVFREVLSAEEHGIPSSCVDVRPYPPCQVHQAVELRI